MSFNLSKSLKTVALETLSLWQILFGFILLLCIKDHKPIKCSIKNNTIRWEKSKDFSWYAIYYSENKNSDGAKLILNNISKNKLKVKKLGYYWVVGKPNLTKTSSFYGQNIPVAVKEYSYTLPISDGVKYY